MLQPAWHRKDSSLYDRQVNIVQLQQDLKYRQQDFYMPSIRIVPGAISIQQAEIIIIILLYLLYV